MAATSGNSVPQDGTGENTPTLLYQTNYPMLVGADTLQQAGITGAGVTIAMLDSGLWQAPSQNYGGAYPRRRIDVTNGGSGPVTGDPYGHGTHITSIAAGGAVNLSGNYLGIAPRANLVIVRAFNGQGAGRYIDVISRPQLDRRQPAQVPHPRRRTCRSARRPSRITGTIPSTRP